MAGQKRILVCDDDDDSLLLFEKILGGRGFAITTVRNGEALLASAGEDDYDVIIVDVMLPGISGVHATRELRNGGNTTPIVAVSSYVRKNDFEELYKYGISDMFEKPVPKQEFLQLVEKLAGN